MKLRRAELARFPNEIRRDQPRYDVAGDGDEADDRVEPHANVGAGQDESPVHKPR